MANFRAYPGLYVKIKETHKNVIKGQIYQIMWVRHHIAFVGVKRSFFY